MSHFYIIQLKILFFLLLLQVPWMFIFCVIFKRRSLKNNIFLGLCGGLAASITSLYIFAALGSFSLVPYWLLFTWVVSLIVLFKQRALFKNIKSEKATYLFWSVLALIAVFYAIPVFSTDFPIGWDPTFHCLLARKIQYSGQLATTWQPFEQIAVNYPLGIHTFIAGLAYLDKAETHLIFQTLHLPVMLLYSVGIYLIACKIFRNRVVGIFAMVSFAFLTDWGSFFNLYQWGGMPTEIAGLMALALILLMIGQRSRLEFVPAVMLCGSMVLVHHLTAFIYFLVIAFFILLNLITRKKLDRCSKKFLMTGFFTLVGYSFFIVPYVLKVSSLGGTSVLKFCEEPIIALDMIVKNLGIVVVVFGIIGLIFVLRSRISNSRTRFLLGWFTGLILFFTVFDHLYRMGAVMILNENFAAFTPSRFLTLLSCPMACYAGFGLKQLAIRLEKIFPVNLKRAVVPLLCLAAAGVAIRPMIKASERRALSPETRALGEMIKQRTPPNAFIFDRLLLGMNERCWLPYLTWRQTLVTPVPASENRRAVYREKLSYLEKNLTDRSKIKQWLEQRGLEGYFVLTGKDGKPVLVKLFKEKR
jgi:hypothetical protein